MSDDKKVFTYPGKDVDVHWDGRLCIHVGECGRADNELFVGGRKPWGQPDLVDRATAEAVCRRCPTGALTVTRHDGTPCEDAPPARNVVTVANNGPLYLTGELDVDGAGDDQPGLRVRAALCRCGKSQNKPFCDGAHEAAGFVDRGAIGSTGDPLEAEGGPLTVKRAPNGPLIVEGNMTLRSGAGRDAWTGTRAALCRCGHSKNKPFCDGAHRQAGFEAE